MHHVRHTWSTTNPISVTEHQQKKAVFELLAGERCTNVDWPICEKWTGKMQGIVIIIYCDCEL